MQDETLKEESQRLATVEPLNGPPEMRTPCLSGLPPIEKALALTPEMQTLIRVSNVKNQPPSFASFLVELIGILIQTHVHPRSSDFAASLAEMQSRSKVKGKL